MIVVSCKSCGKSFKAKDELAGRRGKCPGCGEPIVVPQADEGASAPAPAAARKAAPARRAPARRGGAPAKSGPVGKTTAMSRFRGEKRKAKFDMKIVYAALIMIGVGGGAWGYFEHQRGAAEAPYPMGLELLQSAKFDAAIAQFELVPETDPLYAQAQEKLAEARDLKGAAESRETERLGSNLYNIVVKLEKDWVDRGGKGHESPHYAANARFMLKRAQEFLDKYPKDRRVKEIQTIMWRYEDVASLDVPPTEDDVWQELEFRRNAHQFRESMEVIDEFAAANADATDLVEEMRERVRLSAAEYWVDIRDKLEQDGSLEKGQENWLRVVNMCRRYLDAVEGVPGLTPDRSAQDLHDRAQLGG